MPIAEDLPILIAGVYTGDPLGEALGSRLGESGTDERGVWIGGKVVSSLGEATMELAPRSFAAFTGAYASRGTGVAKFAKVMRFPARGEAFVILGLLCRNWCI